MRLSTKGRYGVRLMLDLALHYGKGSVFLKDISKRQGISEKYLWQLIAALKSKGLIDSNRGARGGYLLAKPPSEITLNEIVQILEGSLSLVECVDKPSLCKRVPFCVSRDIWKEIGDKISQTLESVTLADLVERQKNKKEKNLVYNI